ncbi:SMP-30/gluconolactonase/LRE family protein [Sphingomonas sp. PAMC26645]|uniref:SMP-30/gluconolactonase/LRE family protein n=1 Tax=Sphingomonas sp. PAMC26645 TaxID=2565555 RepID=UPI001FF77BDA|nr:SMP-30/gluconolactonase/LRE family protein [Sphingomonas sp. PAMC26645]
MSGAIPVETTAESICDVGATLGEGPIWIARDAALWFVDIKSPCVHRFDPATGALDTWKAPDQIGWIIPADDGRFLAGVRGALHRFDPATGAFDEIAVVHAETPGNRLNDAARDPTGRVWFGTMDNAESEDTGHVYHWHDGELTKTEIPPVAITNGPAISPDGRTLYAVDTLGKRIDAYPIGADGNVGEPRLFLTIDPDDGYPDGAICDSEGGVWVGFFGGWAARRFAPDGTCTDIVRFPVANITKIALGGPDGRTAYATTAAKGLDDEALAAQPLAGNLFTFRVAIPGVPVEPVTL